MITPTFISSLFFIVFCSCSPFSSAQPGDHTPRLSGFSGPPCGPSASSGPCREYCTLSHPARSPSASPRAPCGPSASSGPSREYRTLSRPARSPSASPRAPCGLIGFLRTLPGVPHSVSPCPELLGFAPRPLRAHRLRPGAGPKRRSAGSIETSAADRIRDSDAPPTSRIAGNTKTDRHNILVMAVLSIRTERRRLAAPAGLRTVSVASGAPGSERQRRTPVVFCAHAGRYCRFSS